MVNDSELTGEASLGRLHPGKERRPVRHGRNLVHYYCEAHPLSPDGACPELPAKLREDEEFVKAHLMLYPSPQNMRVLTRR